MSTEAPTTYYVSPSGSDSNDGLSWDTPVKTILKAYDLMPGSGGTIYIADGSWVGGEVANQGIWIVGPDDPAYSSPPAGWRQGKARVHFIGIGTGTSPIVIQFGRPGAASVVGGRPTDTTQGWVRDSMKPAIWISGWSEPMRFSNLNFPYVQVGARLGVGTDNVSRDRMTALIDFDNVNFLAFVDGGTDQGAGPLVDSGYAFWITWRRSSFLAYASAPLGNDRRASVLLKAGGRAPGLWTIDDCRFGGGGGVKYDVAGATSSWGNVVVTDCLLESDFSTPADPLFWISSYQGYGSACFVRNVSLADAPGSGACVKVPPQLSPDVVTIVNGTSVEGPATLLGSSYPANGSTATQRQVGVTALGPKGPSVARAFGGVEASRFTPMILGQYPPVSTGTVSVSTVAGPVGLSAYRLTSSLSPGSRDGYRLSYLFHGVCSVGDLYVIGGWLRAPDGLNPAYAFEGPAFTIGGTDPNVIFDMSNNSYVVRPSSGDQSWQWVTMCPKVIASDGVVADIVLDVWLYPGFSAEVFQPVVYRFPAGTYNENDVLEWAQHLAPVTGGSTPGNALLLPGQNLEFGAPGSSVGGRQVGFLAAAPTSGTWAAGSLVFNAAPASGQPKGWTCTAGGSPGTWISMGNL
ncbi:MAG TPA: hypothetical protein VIF57_07945 [Polyangia bacterium]|jgi:hypothetical protein